MKILLLSDGIPPYIMGGMQRHTYNLVKYLVLNRVQVKLIHCFNEGEKQFTHEEVCREMFGKEKQDGFDSVMIEFPKPGKIPGHYIRRSYKYSKKIYDAVKNEVDEYDFIYIKGFSGWKLLENKKHFNTKIGVNFHGYEMFQVSPDLKTRIKNQILVQPVRKNMEMADCVFSYGGGITELLKRIEVPEEKIIAINGAVDQVWLNKTKVSSVQGPVRLLFVGRYERRKGIEELHRLLQDFPMDKKFSLTFVGPIPEQVQVADPRIVYHGPVTSVEEIMKIYKENDVLIAPSFSEGMPNVIMEAMSQGLAILATNVGATSLLVNDSNGWLMPCMGDKELKDYFSKVINSSSEHVQKKKEESLHKMDDRFSWPVVAKKHMDFFKTLN